MKNLTARQLRAKLTRSIKMAKREEWTVMFSLSELQEAAQKKKNFHVGRKQWWESKKSDVLDKIKTSGVTVTETIVDELAKTGYFTANAGDRYGPQVQVDPKMQKDLAEAHGKVKEHEAKVRSYQLWLELLTHQNAKEEYELEMDDYVFFFGK